MCSLPDPLAGESIERHLTAFRELASREFVSPATLSQDGIVTYGDARAWPMLVVQVKMLRARIPRSRCRSGTSARWAGPAVGAFLALPGELVLQRSCRAAAIAGKGVCSSSRILSPRAVVWPGRPDADQMTWAEMPLWLPLDDLLELLGDDQTWFEEAVAKYDRDSFGEGYVQGFIQGARSVWLEVVDKLLIP